MKKIILPFFVIALLISSCKKEYVCQCTDASGQKSNHSYYKPGLRVARNYIQKRDLKKSCENLNASGAYGTCEVVKE